MKRRPNAYDRGQHQLVCEALGISDDPNAPGPTAYEAVCVALMKIEYALGYLEDNEHNEGKAEEELKKLLTEPADSEEWCVIKCYP